MNTWAIVQHVCCSSLSRVDVDPLCVLHPQANTAACLDTHMCREDIMKRATNFGRENLLSLGTRLGKFSKKGKFRLHITALSYLAPYAKFKVCVCVCVCVWIDAA